MYRKLLPALIAAGASILTVASAAHASVIFDNGSPAAGNGGGFSDPDKWLQSPARVLVLDRSLVKQNEAVAWENNDSLLITNENRQIFRVPLSALAAEQ